jgi:hypothetical protein
MSENILAAKSAPVPYGYFVIEGFLLETGEFAIAANEVESIFQLPPNSVNQWLEHSLGESSGFYKIMIDNDIYHRENRPENAFSLTVFEKLLRKLDKEGNELAQSMLDALVGLSIRQLWSDSFNLDDQKGEE